MTLKPWATPIASALPPVQGGILLFLQLSNLRRVLEEVEFGNEDAGTYIISCPSCGIRKNKDRNHRDLCKLKRALRSVA